MLCLVQLAGQETLETLVQGFGCWVQVSHALQRFGNASGDPKTRVLFQNACSETDPNIFLSTQARYIQPDGKGPRVCCRLLMIKPQPVEP